MRTYPTDSQEAVCRLLALAMIVDGHMAPSELKAMEYSAILERVGADTDTFDTVLQALCEDMLASASREASAEVELDRSTLDSLFGEIADPLLRMCTLKAMLDIVHADQMLDSREHLLLQRALKKWSAPAEIGRLLRPN
ncbi:tellurite resistance TerB family protein [Massilia sp. GCM10023247]|uniref:tellurite resistance TerB family protein n=1 Tax=Massilia sp. GCM10023247 TaxID=3252643 RepID=UPI0036169FAE